MSHRLFLLILLLGCPGAATTLYAGPPMLQSGGPAGREGRARPAFLTRRLLRCRFSTDSPQTRVGNAAAGLDSLENHCRIVREARPNSQTEQPQLSLGVPRPRPGVQPTPRGKTSSPDFFQDQGRQPAGAASIAPAGSADRINGDKQIMLHRDRRPPRVSLEVTDPNWIPGDGNQVEVKLSWAGVSPSRVRFSLEEVSHEPGTCLNGPDRNTGPDLEIAASNVKRGFRLGPRHQTAVKDRPQAGFEILAIRSHDFGAYGRLEAAVLVKGNWLTARVKESGATLLPVPPDNNENHIADEWEKEVGVYSGNYDADWDEDPRPGGQRRSGDGYTLYEEYRGFVAFDHVLQDGSHVQIEGAHFRMDPNFKDVFVYDPDGLFRQYYAPYNAAELNWHVIGKDMMKFSGDARDPKNRWVNFNTSKKFFYARQYAIFVKNWSSSVGSLAGEVRTLDDLYRFLDEINQTNTPHNDICSNWLAQPLKCVYMVKVYTLALRIYAEKNNPAQKDVLYNDLLTTTVIHEIGHAIGIHHHWNLRTGKPDEKSLSSGVLSCAMRYDRAEDIFHPGLIKRTRYCHKGETWKEYVPAPAGKSREPFPIQFKVHPSHNCFGQIDVKTDP